MKLIVCLQRVANTPIAPDHSNKDLVPELLRVTQANTRLHEKLDGHHAIFTKIALQINELDHLVSRCSNDPSLKESLRDQFTAIQDLLKAACDR